MTITIILITYVFFLFIFSIVFFITIYFFCVIAYPFQYFSKDWSRKNKPKMYENSNGRKWNWGTFVIWPSHKQTTKQNEREKKKQFISHGRCVARIKHITGFWFHYAGQYKTACSKRDTRFGCVSRSSRWSRLLFYCKDQSHPSEYVV